MRVIQTGSIGEEREERAARYSNASVSLGVSSGAAREGANAAIA